MSGSENDPVDTGLPFPERNNVVLTGRLRDMQYVEFPDALSSTEALVTRPGRFAAGHPSVEGALIGLYHDRFHLVWVKHGERVSQTQVPFDTVVSVEVKPQFWPPFGRRQFRKMTVTGVNGVVQHWRVDYRFAANAEYIFKNVIERDNARTALDDRSWRVQGENADEGFYVVGYNPYTMDHVLASLPDLYGPYATLEDAEAVAAARDPSVRSIKYDQPSAEPRLPEPPSPTNRTSKFREVRDPDGTFHSYCYFCGDEVPQDEVSEWGAWGDDASGWSTIVRAHRRCRDEGLEWGPAGWRLKTRPSESTTPPSTAPPPFPTAHLPKRSLVTAVPRSSGGGKAEVYRLVGRAYGERDGDRYYGGFFYVTPNRYPDRQSAFAALEEYARGIGVELSPYAPFRVDAPDRRYFEEVDIRSFPDAASDPDT